MKYILYLRPADGRRPYSIQNIDIEEVKRKPEMIDAVSTTSAVLPALAKQFGRELTKEYLAREVLPKNGIGLEIGVDMGDGLDLWLESEPRLVMAVDPWLTSEHDSWYSSDQTVMDKRHASVVERFSDAPEVVVVRSTSDDYFAKLAANNVTEPFLDWCHIDGDHETEPTYRDLVNCWRFLKVGGVLMLDDTHCAHWRLKINAARDRFLAETTGHSAVIVDHSDPWAIRKEA
jgi:hypothetical protein